MKLQEIRENKGINQTKAAMELNLNRVTYNNWELGKTQPNIETLIKLADYYKVSLDHLLGRQFSKILYLEHLTQEQQEVVQMVSKLDPVQVGKTKVYILALTGQISF